MNPAYKYKFFLSFCSAVLVTATAVTVIGASANIAHAGGIVNGAPATGMIGHLDANNNPHYTVGGVNQGPNALGFDLPNANAIDTVNHRLFVVDSNNNRVLVFPLDSTNGIATTTPSYVLGQADFVSNTSATTQNGLAAPDGLAFDPIGERLFVSDESNDRILVFDVAPADIHNGENALNVLGQSDFVTSGNTGISSSSMSAPAGMSYDPATSRLFLADSSNSRILVFDVDAATIQNGEAAIHELGEPDFVTNDAFFFGTSANILDDPQDVSYDTAENRLFVADTSQNRVVIFPASTSTLSDNESATAVLGQTDLNSAGAGDSSSSLADPNGIFYDPSSQRVFVTKETGTVFVYDNAGSSTLSDGQPADVILGEDSFSNQVGPDLFTQPTSISYEATGDHLFISDNGNNRIMVFAASTSTLATDASANMLLGHENGSGNPLFNLSGANDGPNPQGFNSPEFSALDPVNHRIFVSDSNNNRVLVFNLNSSNQFSDTSASYVLGQTDLYSATSTVSINGMSAPQGLAYDSVDQRLFVVDAGNNRVLSFNVAPGTIASGEDASSVLGQVDFNSNSSDTSSSTLNFPEGLAYDAANQRLFVSDSSNNRILSFSVGTSTFPSGEPAAHVLGQSDFVSGGNGTSSSTLRSPEGVAYDAVNSRLFVADNTNARVISFDVTPASIQDGEGATYLIGSSDFNDPGSSGLSPIGLAYESGSDRLFVANAGTNTVLVYDISPAYIQPFIDSQSFNETSENAIGTAGSPPPAQNSLDHPNGVSFDSGSNTLFVVDGGYNRVMSFSASAGPLIALTTHSINLTAASNASSTNEGPQYVVITNTGDAGTTLNWTSSSTQSWLTVSPTSGSLGSQATSTITISANPSGLAGGFYFATATLSDSNAGNSPQTITVKLSVAGPNPSATALLGQIDANGNPLFQSGGSDNSPNNIGFNNPSYSAIDTVNHRLFVADAVNNRILVFNLDSSDAIASPTAAYVLGQPNFSSSSALSASSTTMSGPASMAYDATSSRLFVSDPNNNRVLVFDVAPADIHNGEAALNVLGQSNFTNVTSGHTSSTLSQPQGLAYDGANARLFVADASNNRILAFNVSTSSIHNGEVAANVLGQSNFTNHGSNTTSSTLSQPTGLAYDSSNGRLFVSDSSNLRVLMYKAAVGTIANGEVASSVLGQTIFTSAADNGISSSSIEDPIGLDYDDAGKRLFVVDGTNTRVLVFTVGTSTFTNNEGAVHVLGQPDFVTNGVINSLHSISSPEGITYDPIGNHLFVVDNGYSRVLMFNVASISDGDLPVNLLGHNDPSGPPAFDATGANSAPNAQGFDDPFFTELDAANHRLFVSDTGNNRVLVFDLNSENQIASTSAAYVLGQSGLADEISSTTQVNLLGPEGLAYDAAGKRLFVADTVNNRVVVFNVDPGTIASGEAAMNVIGQPDFMSGGGDTSSTTFNNPQGLAYDPVGERLFVADANNGRVLVFNVGSVSDNEPAAHVLGAPDFVTGPGSTSSSTLAGPVGLAYDAANNRLFVADSQNNRVLVFNTASITDGQGAINILGQSDFVSSNFSSAQQNNFANPLGLAFDSSNQRLFLVDNNDNRVLGFAVAPGTIMNDENASDLVGQAFYSDSAGGTSVNHLEEPFGASYDPISNDVFVADANNNRVISFAVTTPTASPSISLSMSSVDYTATQGAASPDQGTQDVTITNDGSSGSTLNWTASSNESWLTFSASSGALAQNATSSIGLIVDASSLPVGVSSAIATISDADATNSPQTITVQITISAASGGGGGGGGGNVSVGVSSGGGGGGGGYIPPVTPTPPTSSSTSPVVPPTSTAGLTPAQLQALIVQLTTEIQLLEARLAAHGGSGGGIGPTAPAAPTTGAFLKNLQLGSVSPDVKRLQDFLNTHGFPVARKGQIGAPGRETEYFWIATKATLIKYQKAAGIVPASGYFGPLTRAYINKILGE